MKRKDKGRLPPFVPLLVETMKTPAWRALSHGAQCLYVALKGRYSITLKNNGRLYLSQRDAQVQLRSHRQQIGRWFRELQFYGFIIMTQHGNLGLDGRGKAPHWRLTEIGYMADPPTKDFLRWDGIKFKDEPPGQKKFPGAEKRTRVVRKSAPPADPSGAEKRSIYGDGGGAEKRSISRLNHSPSLETGTSSEAEDGPAKPKAPVGPVSVADPLDIPTFLRRVAH